MNQDQPTAELSEIRKEFFALRNGLIADTLRKGGLEQKYIFGLQLPQLKDIANRRRPEDPQKSALLARKLWEDIQCREARLLACHLMPPELLGKEEMKDWAKGVNSREEADILAFRLLKHIAEAISLIDELASSEKPLERYTAEAISRFF